MGFVAAQGYVDLKLSGTAGLEAGIGAVSGKLHSMGKSMQGVSKIAQRLLMTETALAAGSIAIGSGFEQSMQVVRSVSKATEDQFSLLRDKALELGRTTKYTSTDAANGMVLLSQAGFKVQETLVTMGPVLNLAAASGMDLAETADIVAKTLRQMQLPATESGRVSDVLAAGFTNANTTVGMLGEALSYVGPTAASLNYSLEDTVSLIAALSDSGVQAGRAGTSLNVIMGHLSNATVAAKFNDLGVSLKDTEGNIRPLVDILADTKAALEATGDASAIATFAFGTFGQRGGPAFQILMRKSREELVRFSNMLKGSTGEAARIAGEQMDTLRGTLLKLKSALEANAISLSDSLTPSIRKAVEAILPFLERTSQILASNPKTVASIIGLSAALLLIVAVVPKVLFSLGLIAQGALLLPKVFAGVSMAIGILAKTFIVGVVGIGSFLVGYRLGDAMDRTFDLSGLLLKTSNFLAGMVALFMVFAENLASLLSGVATSTANFYMSTASIVAQGVKSILSGGSIPTDMLEKIGDAAINSAKTTLSNVKKFMSDMDKAGDSIALSVKAENAKIDAVADPGKGEWAKNWEESGDRLASKIAGVLESTGLIGMDTTKQLEALKKKADVEKGAVIPDMQAPTVAGMPADEKRMQLVGLVDLYKKISTAGADPQTKILKDQLTEQQRTNILLEQANSRTLT